MARSAWIGLAVALFAVSVDAADAPAAITLDGKVAPLAEALKKLGAKPDSDTAGVALTTADGKVYTLVKDDASRLLFLDPQLHNRDLRIKARVLPGSQTLKVEKVQAVRDGKLFDLVYWCDNCQLGAAEPGKCFCCGGETTLREVPAK